MMRVLIASESFPPKAGGSGWSAYALAKGLRARGHYVEIAQPRPGMHGRAEREYDGLKVTEFGYSATNVPGARALGRRMAITREFTAPLAVLAREFDIIHAQHVLTIPPAVEAARRASSPEGSWGAVVSTVRDYWPVCLYGTLWREGEICSVCAPNELLRCLRQRYGRLVEFARPLLPLVQNELHARQRSLAHSDAVIAVSRFVADKLEGLVPPSKLAVVPNVVDMEGNPDLTEPEARGEPFLLYVGKLTELKGADLLPEILRRSGVSLPLLVLGEGPAAAGLAQSPQVRLFGWKPNDEVLKRMRRATALLFPSRWAEPLARTLLEAQVLGVPTIAFDTGGTRDIITPDVNGLVARDVDEFALHLKRLVEDGALRLRLREGARRQAMRYTPEVVLPQVEAVYARALQARRGEAPA